MYKYWGFGLRIESEIEFAELLPADFTEADISITSGVVPEKLDGEGVVKKVFSSISGNGYLLNVRNTCKYYAAYGNKIIFEPAPGIDGRSIRLFLLGSVMAAILYQRGNIPLHAAAIIKDGKLILFAGNSGAGKSTLLAHLATKGYAVFTDDICVLQNNSAENKEVFGVASYPMMKLWDDAISKIGNDQFTREFKVRPKLPKFGQFFYDTFNMESLPVDKIFILSPKNDISEISTKKIAAVQAFSRMEKQAYKYQLIANIKLRGLHFSLLSQLINQVPIYEVSRPENATKVNALSDILENLF